MRNLGLVLIVFSFLPWGVVALLPVLSLPVGQKALLVPVLAVVAEVCFWLGLLLVGKEAAAKYRRYFSPRYLWKRLSELIRKQ
ncbi:MAG: transporter suffix domain-containing protein [Oscillatoria princeps RMCB-10]|jgi:predicted membrane chloride channel (bestrophin family)|nr:transporter suffix domain-containing protein [Oscillatoria princeps RMCB-10]